MKVLLFLLLFTSTLTMIGQKSHLQYFRPNNQLGLSTFETTKTDTVSFSNLKVRIGGNFAQDFQSLQHSNNATVVMVESMNANELVRITRGFNLAMANLNIDVQLADGIRLNLTSYLSTRHHPETWVKSGYIQFDKLAFLKNAAADRVMKYLTLKVGNLEVDYGDQHFRRTDGGNAIHNPFVENYIMDEFATEIGSEVYYHNKNGIFGMLGVTNGMLNPVVVASGKIDSATGKRNKYAAAFHGKLGFDRQFNRDLRFRLTGSVYTDKSAAGNSLFFGDRAGSHYFFIMENTTATASANAFSGRFNPSFSQEVHAFMLNPFIKFQGMELFGTYEIARGRKISEPALRAATQIAVDFIYRFPKGKENFWIASRINSVTSKLPLVYEKVTITRKVASMGWFLTHNILLKGEYVQQAYRDFPQSDIRREAEFQGWMLQAVVGF